MTMRIAVLVAAVAALGGTAAAQGKNTTPDPAIRKAIETIQKKTASVQSIKADYIREYTIRARSGAIVEDGQFLWQRTPDGGVFSRWEGRDENGPILTIVRNRKISVYRGKKKTSEGSMDQPHVLHPARFGFPMVPPTWGRSYRIGGPRTSPEYDDRFPAVSTGGIPSVLTLNTSGHARRFFTRVSFSFDEKTALAWRFRCDTAGWTLLTVELLDMKLNPTIPPGAFEPPKGVEEEKKEGGTEKAAAK
jgi:outer membrane lipoprotein-sorting protein